MVALDSNGNPVAETEIRTAGIPARIELRPDRSRIMADGRDLLFITVRITDADGVLCPLADSMVHFDLEGPCRIVAVGNGDPTSVAPFVADHRKAFNGLCVLIVGSVEGSTGRVSIRAIADGLRQAKTEVLCESLVE